MYDNILVPTDGSPGAENATARAFDLARTGDATIHIAGSSKRRLTRTQRKRRKRRSAVEPKIGHAKHDNRLSRCYLKGLTGDAMNVILAAAGANLAKLLRLLPCAARAWLVQCKFALPIANTHHSIKLAA